MWESIQQSLQNQLLGTGLVLMLAGGLMALLRRVPERIYHVLKRLAVVNVDIVNQSAAYDWLVDWLSHQPYSHRARSLTVVSGASLYQYQNLKRVEGEESEAVRSIPRLVLSPGIGFHFFFLGRRPIWINRKREQAPVETFSRFYEDITLSTFVWGGGRKALLRLVNEAADAAHVDDDRIRLRVPVWDNWTTASNIIPRSLDSVILPEGAVESICADIHRFRQSRAWYNRMGIPYRRGYLLHGAPGNGKTSLIVGLASEFQMDVYILNLGAYMNDQKLMNLVMAVPENCLLVIEDIDAAFHERKNTNDSERLTFSGLLNAVDGVTTSNGRILIATTNHRDRLDPALVRPGRIDYQLEIGNATALQVQRMYNRFFDVPQHPLEIHSVESAERGRKFANSVPNGSVSMADVQNYLLKRIGDSRAVVNEVSKLIRPINGKADVRKLGHAGFPAYQDE